MVTARASMAVRESRECGPSGVLVPKWRWGVKLSIAKRKPIPSRKPTADGSTDQAPLACSISIAGMSSDHTDAATITPEAKSPDIQSF